MKINIACDHAGYEYKNYFMELLQELDHIVNDFGTHGPESVDYPDYIHPMCNDMVKKEVPFGIIICGSANGVAMTANKNPHIRAAICWSKEIASLARQHNNANVIAIPARVISKHLAWDMIQLFITTAFEGGRHERRVNKIAGL